MTESIHPAVQGDASGVRPYVRRKVRMSIIFSIAFSMGFFFLTSAGIGWLALYKQQQTITTVTILYNNAFEAVNDAHKAYADFEHLMTSRQGPNASFTDAEARESIAAIQDDLDLAGEFTASPREEGMISGIRENLGKLSMGGDVAAVAAGIEHELIALVRQFTTDRLESTEEAGRAIEDTKAIVRDAVGLALILGCIMGAVMALAILPQIRHGVTIAEAIAGGKLDNQIVIKGMKETAQLLGALSRMQASISKHVADLEEARARAIKSENAKSEFLANMSHELRTPLNNIIGSIQLLQNRTLPDKDRELFELVGRSSKSLLGIVNDILDLSKIEAGEVKLEHIGFDAFGKIRDVATLFMAQAGKKNLTMASETGEGHLYMLGDPLRFERILTNLVGNAMRYTEKGGIRLRGFRKKGADGQDRIRCEVVDTGIGIPKDRQEKIFERFTQADNSTSRKYGGTGLGLTITRELIYLMKGEIGVDSEVGKGSTFWFELPFEAAAGAEDEAAPAAAAQAALASGEGAVDVAKARVLIAEDQELNRIFMRQLLDSMGFTGFIFAETGTEAVDKVRSEDFDVVLMDCHMPEMDGYQATAAIRSLPDASRRAVPIVAMTANAMATEEQRCRNAGMDAYISKPFEFQAFRRILSPWIAFDTADNVAAKRAPVAAAVPADLEVVTRTARGDVAYIKEIVGLFIQTADRHLDELEALCGPDADGHAWIEAAHALKGAASIIGAHKLQDLAAQAQIMEVMPGDARKEIALAIKNEYRVVKDYVAEKQLI